MKMNNSKNSKNNNNDILSFGSGKLTVENMDKVYIIHDYIKLLKK